MNGFLNTPNYPLDTTYCIPLVPCSFLIVFCGHNLSQTHSSTSVSDLSLFGFPSGVGSAALAKGLATGYAHISQPITAHLWSATKLEPQSRSNTTCQLPGNFLHTIFFPPRKLPRNICSLSTKGYIHVNGLTDNTTSGLTKHSPCPPHAQHYLYKETRFEYGNFLLEAAICIL